MKLIPAICSAVLLALSTVATPLIAAEHDHSHHHGHHHGQATAPIGVMGDHVMAQGEWMVSYRFMQMDMEGNRSGTDRVSTPLPGYMVSPLSMTMDMHMLGAMVGVTDELTVMVMVPLISMEMEHLTMMGGRFTTESDGVGDVKISLAYDIGGGTLLNAGLSLANGSIDERDVTPASSPNTAQLPYPMQIGSGTFDLMLGATHVAQTDAFTWGVQGMVTLRTGENDRDYTLGNRLQLGAWMSKSLADKISGSVRLNAQDWDDIDGADAALNPMMVPTADPQLRAGTRVDAILGLNLELGQYSIGFEYAVPVHQDLDGPQLETDSVLTLGAIARF